MLQDPLVHPLKPPAKQGDALRFTEAPRHRLIKRFAARRKVDDGPGDAAFGRALGGLVQCHSHDIGAQHHACAAACGCVIDVAVLADTKGPQIKGFQRPESEIQRLSGQRQTQDTGKRLGKQRDDFGPPRPGNPDIRHQVTRFQAGRDFQPAMGSGSGIGCIAHGLVLTPCPAR